MLVHTESNSLLLKVKNLSQIQQLIPKHKLVDIRGHNLAVRFGLDEVKVLNNLGIKAPSPILYDYPWPGKFEHVMDHQKQTAAMLTLNKRAFVLNETGTMKTASALWAADYLMKQGKIQRCLIVAKLSTLERVWIEEIFSVLMHRNAVVLHDTRERRLEKLALDVDFYIINHEGLEIIADELVKRKDIGLIILDEASEYRNAPTNKFKTLARVLKQRHYFWPMTATPCPNAPTDAWALARLVCPDRVPQYFGQFKKMTMLQVGPYKWIPKKGSADIAYNAMQPAVRYRKADCLDLPPLVVETRDAELSVEQKKVYTTMRNKLILETPEGAVMAVNAADKINKLRQILCIAYNTPVLCKSGWKPIQEIASTDVLWDGVEWVPHGGLIHKGAAKTIKCDGVFLTPDHAVLTTKGWATAWEICNDESGTRFIRPDVRVPEGYQAPRHNYRGFAKSDMALPMRLRQTGCSREPKSKSEKTPQRQTLRVSAQGYKREASYVLHKTTSNMVQNEKSVHPTFRQRLEKLWRSWHYSMRALETVVRKFLGRQSAGVRGYANVGQNKQQRGVCAGELPMGNGQATMQQHAGKSNTRYPTRAYDSNTGSSTFWYGKKYSFLPNKSRLANYCSVNQTSAEKSEVFDILNCGPRNRFVVRGENGELLVVHNCGAVKETGSDIYMPLDHTPRLKVLLECIELATAKSIVIVPFKGILQILETEVSKHHSCAILNGDVSPKKRNEIITAFKTQPDPKVLLCHPKVMAHGLNLTEADMTIFYAPIYSNDEAMQVIERFNRPGQTRKMTLIRMSASKLEDDIYAMLDGKQRGQESILDLYMKHVVNS